MCKHNVSMLTIQRLVNVSKLSPNREKKNLVCIVKGLNENLIMQKENALKLLGRNLFCFMMKLSA